MNQIFNNTTIVFIVQCYDIFVKRNLFAFMLYAFHVSCFSTSLITLEDALNVHVYNTKFIQIKRMSFDNAIMECENFKKSLLPSISFNFSPLSFDHSMRLLQNYISGEYSNVEEFSNTTYGGMNISQIIAATGGTLSLGSSLSFLREFSNNVNSFSTSPLYISYSQSLFGGGKSFSYQKMISKIKLDVAMKSFCSSVSEEQQNILQMYLETYTNKLDVEFYTQNVYLGDTLLYYAKLRKDEGKITEYEYNQVELQQLDNKMSLEKAVFAYNNSVCQLENELSIHEIELGQLTVSKFPENLNESVIIDLINKNNPEYKTLELERLTSEYLLHQKKVSNRFNANISLSYGLNQYAKTFNAAYSNPDQRQALSVSFSIPVFQWGINRNNIKIAQNEYESVLLEQERTKERFSENIHNYVFNYNMSRHLFEIAEKKFRLSEKQYSFAATRFKVGKIAAIELTNAGQEYLQAKQNFVSVMHELYVNYYKIRHVSLYDFIDNCELSEIILKSSIE